ncbi:acylneuraminate cytidylyltransferase family protein [Fodinicurvata fenggangensis]|uniref:acylneuraminate cytidylyltransferase family protein n=1 Tax=Fodinicurvata fenggangensis TaxID=1121830 RepID=UPI000556E730|nr:acylneuraminate cytidylyltransferase family protein [Fodinicurvata fenggangensis]
MRAVAIIPARGGSKRLPRKNILPLGGRPMIAHPIRLARESGLFERVVVSTEDTEIAEIARIAGAEVFERDTELATDKATVVQVCLDALRRLEQEGTELDAFCCLYATAAFLTMQDVQDSRVRLFGPPEADYVMGVSEYPIHPFKALRSEDGYLKAVWPESAQLKSQEYPAMCASNGTLYWARSGAFIQEQSFYGQRLVGYELPPNRAIDIDTREDYDWACRLAAASKLGQGNE